METSTQQPLDTLGARLRAARKAHGFSQEVLAAPEFTKSYISAVERSKARPSLKALALLSQRLGLPITALLTPETGTADQAAVVADFTAQLDQAQLYLEAGDAGAAEPLLDTAAAAAHALADLPRPLQVRLAYLQGRTLLGQQAFARAREVLTAALPLAEKVDAETVVALRYRLGQAVAAAGLPDLAEEHYHACVDAIAAGTVQDPGLCLAIYRSILATPGLAQSGLPERVAPLATALLDSRGSLAQQARALTEAGRAAEAAGETERARRYSAAALGLWEVATQNAAAAEIHLALADTHLGAGDLARAAEHGTRAQALLPAAGPGVTASRLQEQAARLALAQDQLDAAHAAAAQAVALATQAQTAASQDEAAQAAVRHALVRAHATAGQIAERQGVPAEAETHFAQALEIAAAEQDRPLRSSIEERYAELLAARGAYAEAAAHYRAALQARSRQAEP